MKLHEYLEANQITQEEFARRIGRTQGEVSRYCTGDRVPKLRVLADIQRATEGKVTLEAFIEESAA